MAKKKTGMTKSQKRNQKRKAKALAAKKAGTKVQPRKGKTNRASSSGGGFKATTQTTMHYEWTTNTVKGNDNGKVVIGKDSTYEKLKNAIAGYQRYRVFHFEVLYITEAASTDRGCLAYRLDNSNSLSSKGLSKDNTWGLRSNGRVAYNKTQLCDKDFYEFNENQFAFLYEGTGESVTVGHMKYRCSVLLSMPK
nr:CP [raspberry enamovirus 1]WOS61101.1 CP [raspberry enamovirus 1]WOS61111.1 CP [raspberry enamovirus 1]WOS61116.1 CP [raspberry enamovirus 1]WOS61121.1 CP [raspberry enamovirus 1]